MKKAGKQTKLTNYWLGPKTTTTNQFDTLSDDEIEPQTVTESKPPPIFVNEVDNIAPLQELLKIIAPNLYDMKIINSNNVKIMSKTKESYVVIVNALTEKSTMFHTYQMKENRAFRVVLRNVHHTTNIDEIKEELAKLGHIVRNIHNIVQRTTKKNLPMFFVDLEPKPNNKDIYNIQLLMHLRVQFEPQRKKKDIVQCTKCQRYGHTKRFCFNVARCVKCVGNHATESCKRTNTDSSVQCVLCLGNHPANYRGCEIYKELQVKQFPTSRERVVSNLNIPPNSAPSQSTTVKPNITYAQAVRIQTPQKPHSSRPQSTSSTSNDATQNIEHSEKNDILELKNMMKALIEQMGTIMNLLTIVVTNLNKLCP